MSTAFLPDMSFLCSILIELNVWQISIEEISKCFFLLLVLYIDTLLNAIHPIHTFLPFLKLWLFESKLITKPIKFLQLSVLKV